MRPPPTPGLSPAARSVGELVAVAAACGGRRQARFVARGVDTADVGAAMRRSSRNTWMALMPVPCSRVERDAAYDEAAHGHRVPRRRVGDVRSDAAAERYWWRRARRSTPELRHVQAAHARRAHGAIGSAAAGVGAQLRARAELRQTRPPPARGTRSRSLTARRRDSEPHAPPVQVAHPFKIFPGGVSAAPPNSTFAALYVASRVRQYASNSPQLSDAPSRTRNTAGLAFSSSGSRPPRIRESRC